MRLSVSTWRPRAADIIEGLVRGPGRDPRVQRPHAAPHGEHARRAPGLQPRRGPPLPRDPVPRGLRGQRRPRVLADAEGPRPGPDLPARRSPGPDRAAEPRRALAPAGGVHDLGHPRRRRRRLPVPRRRRARLLSTSIGIGTRLPVQCSAAGWAILSTWTRPALDAWLADHPLKRYTAHTVTGSRAFRAAIRRAAAQGFVLLENQYEIGLRGISVPLRSSPGEVVGAISVSSTIASASRRRPWPGACRRSRPAPRRCAPDSSRLDGAPEPGAGWPHLGRPHESARSSPRCSPSASSAEPRPSPRLRRSPKARCATRCT